MGQGSGKSGGGAPAVTTISKKPISSGPSSSNINVGALSFSLKGDSYFSSLSVPDPQLPRTPLIQIISFEGISRRSATEYFVKFYSASQGMYLFADWRSGGKLVTSSDKGFSSAENAAKAVEKLLSKFKGDLKKLRDDQTF